ncbi:MAG: hypothetical protein ABR497_03825 [Kiritimatiellia bacterium]
MISRTRRSVIISLSLAARLALAAGFDLQINDVSGIDESWPMTAGLPFAAGVLRDAGQIRLVDAAGTEVPAQVDVAATWRDGSIRWALAGFTASPRGRYRVEYGPGVERETAPAVPLKLEQAASGMLTINTGAAVYEFAPDALLPARVIMDGVTVVADAGAGAYLLDNHGREARVAGAAAAVQTEIVRQGPARAVILRQGFYVTGAGVRLARARAWFYLAVGSPYLRITHSLVFTEDTNEVWIRDYGLEFNTPAAPNRARFALGPPGAEELFEADPGGDEVYLLQDTFPHYRERASRAVVARVGQGKTDILTETALAGDWADADYAGYGLTLVVPWLAQQFPKEISFGPQRAKAALWSGRSGRELDFRARTLVREYWGEWAELIVENADTPVKSWINKYWNEDREPEGAEALAEWPSNAQGAARTHDVWLLPHKAGDDADKVRARAVAAARPPLVLADPVHLCATEAIGWPTHPRDPARFPREEAMLSAHWERLMAQFDALPRTGFIGWGGAPYLSINKMFRLGILADYGLRRAVWGLYARGGERHYHDYGVRYNRHIADWWVHHWNAGDKFRGGFATPGGYWEGHLG